MSRLERFKVSFVIEGEWLGDDAPLDKVTIVNVIESELTEEGAGDYFCNRSIDTKVSAISVLKLNGSEKGKPELKCPKCDNEDDFILAGEGVFSIRRRTDLPDEIDKSQMYAVENVACSSCQHSGYIDEF